FLFLLSELFYITQPRPVQIALLQRLAVHRVPEQFVFSSTLIFLQFMCYMVLALRLIVSYKKEANQHFSSPRRTDVSWLYSTVIFFMVVIVSSGANGWLTQTPLTQYYLLFFNIMILALLIFVLRTLMGTLRGSHLLLTEENYQRGKNTLLFKNNETENDAKEQAAQSLLAYMKASKPFLEPDLTLDELAAQLSFKSKFLSQVINERLRQNFFDLINRYRIEEAARLLTNPRDKKITILEVLYKVGFNSKSSFNTLFKKYTGMTPTEFKKNQSSIKEL
ncbi:MAG: helix-turn-helix domain-containing protein, partial [Mucilaginibacter sp.]